MWKSFLEVVRFILTKFDPVSSHGDPVRAKSYICLLIFEISLFMFEHFLKRGEQCRVSGAATQRNK